MTIEEMLKAGKNPEEMMKELSDQIKEAQERIKKDKEAEQEAKQLASRDSARMNLAGAIAGYLRTYGMELDVEDVKELNEMLRDVEQEMKEMSGLMKLMFSDLENKLASREKDECGSGSTPCECRKNKTTDEIINNFLKGII